MKDIWRITPKDEIWSKQWTGYDSTGKEYGGQIILVNASPKLIEAISKAFNETEGMKLKVGLTDA